MHVLQSLPVAIIAVTWMIFNTTVFFFPSNPNPNAADMNYAVVVLGGTLGLALIYYYLPRYGGVHWFRGPISNIEVEEENREKAYGDLEEVYHEK